MFCVSSLAIHEHIQQVPEEFLTKMILIKYYYRQLFIIYHFMFLDRFQVLFFSYIKKIQDPEIMQNDTIITEISADS